MDIIKLKWDNQGLCNVLWSLSVMNVSEISPSSFNNGLLQLQRNAASLLDVEKNQVYQSILNIRHGGMFTNDKISIALDGIEASFEKLCATSFKESSHDVFSSKLHENIYLLVQSLGHVAWKEFIIREGLAIDIVILKPRSGSLGIDGATLTASNACMLPREDLVLIEVDGPSHFNSRTRKETMVSHMKKRILRGMGYKHVIGISYFQWIKLKTREQKIKFLEETVHACSSN
jgi:hypothetical protein